MKTAKFILNEVPQEDRVLYSDQIGEWYWKKILPDAEAIYLQPGDSPNLIANLKAEGFSLADCMGKKVYCYSAGVSAVTTNSFNLDHWSIVHGLGFLPISSIVHWREGLEWAIEYLEMKFRIPVYAFDERIVLELTVSEEGKVIKEKRHYKELPKPISQFGIDITTKGR